MFRNATHIYGKVVREELRTCLSAQGYSTVPPSAVRVFSEGMKSALLREAVRFAECSISNVAQATHLLGRDYTDWPIVTYYYTSFYAICALIRTQGYATTFVGNRLHQVEPDTSSPDWWFVSPAGNRGHIAVWNHYDACFSINPTPDGR